MTDKTTATVGEAASFPVSMPSGEAAGTVMAALGSVVVGILWFRRKTSRDGTEIIKDKADAELTKSLMANAEAKALEAKEAREETKSVWLAHNLLVSEAAQLRATNEYLRQEIARLTAELEKAQNKLDQVRDDLWKLRKRGDQSGQAPLS